MVNLILISLVFPLLAFVLESYPRFLNKKFGVDIWTHLLYLKEYHRQGKIPKRIGEKQGFLVEGEYDYPPAFIRILSKIPFKLVKQYEFLFSPFFDLLHLIFIFFLVQFLTGNILLALLTQLLYILTPIIILENSSATPRSLGYMLFTILFISIFLFQEYGNYLFLMTALIAGSLIFLSHRFTTQGFLFFALFFSVLEKNPIYIVVFLASFTFALIISDGFYLKVLKGHIGNLIFWYKNIRYRFAHQVKGNYKEQRTEDFIFKLYNQFLKFPPFVLAITNPWILPVFYIFVFARFSDPLLIKITWWVMFSYILALSTVWIPKLRFLGEGQRYLELSAFPTAFLAAKLLFDSFKTQQGILFIVGYILFGLGSLITIFVIQRKGIIKDKLRTVGPSMEKMFLYLRSLKIKPKLLCIPHQITTSTIYHTDCSVFVNANYTDIQKISEVYPYIRKPIKEIMKKYSLDMILLNEEYARATDLKVRFKILKKIENFLLIKPL